MKNMFIIEMRKSLCNKSFLIVISLTCAISVIAAILNIVGYKNAMIYFAESNSVLTENPWLPVYSLYSRWLADDFNNDVRYIYYLLLPLFASFCYGWSYSTELDSGYVKNIMTRTSKKNYFSSKYFSVFISGGMTALIPILVNILIVACFVPAIKPDMFYNMQYGHAFSTIFSFLFFKYPLLYLVAMTVLTFIFAGLYGCMSLACTFAVKNKIAVLIIPFIILLAINYASGIFMEFFANIGEISPLKFLHTTAGNPRYLWIALIEIIIMFILTFIITMRKGIKNEIY